MCYLRYVSHEHMIWWYPVRPFQQLSNGENRRQVVWVSSFLLCPRPPDVPGNEEENQARPVRVPKAGVGGGVRRGEGADQRLPQHQSRGEADHRPSAPDKVGFGE